MVGTSMHYLRLSRLTNALRIKQEGDMSGSLSRYMLCLFIGGSLISCETAVNAQPAVASVTPAFAGKLNALEPHLRNVEHHFDRQSRRRYEPTRASPKRDLEPRPPSP